MTTECDTLNALFTAAVGGDGVAVGALADELATRLPVWPDPAVEVWTGEAKLYLDAYRVESRGAALWGHLTGEKRPFRWGQFSRDGFATEFADWLREALAR